RAAHLNVVAEDLVEADLERLDPGPLALGLLQPGDPLPRLTGRSAQAVELGAEPGADCRPAPEDGRRLVNQRLYDQTSRLRAVGRAGHEARPVPVAQDLVDLGQ